MMLNANIKIELTHEQQVKAVISILGEEYASLAKDALNFDARRGDAEISYIDIADYDNWISAMKSIDGVLEYYMEDWHYQNWKSAWKRARELYS